MVKSVSISKTIVSLADLHARLGLWRSLDRSCFTEWCDGLFELSEIQQQALARSSGEYDLSDTFSLLFNRENKLYGVLKALNRISVL